MVLSVNHLSGFGGGNSASTIAVATSTTGTATSSVSFTVTVPTGAAVDDVLLLFTSSNDNLTLSFPGTSMTTLETSAAGGLTIYAFGRICTGTEGATFSVNSDASRNHSWIFLRISGAATGTISAVTDTNEAPVATGSTADVASTTITWGASIQSLCVLSLHWDSVTSGASFPTGYADTIESNVSNASVAIATKLVSASSENPGAETAPGGGRCGGNLVIVKGL